MLKLPTHLIVVFHVSGWKQFVVLSTNWFPSFRFLNRLLIMIFCCMCVCVHGWPMITVRSVLGDRRPHVISKQALFVFHFIRTNDKSISVRCSPQVNWTVEYRWLWPPAVSKSSPSVNITCVRMPVTHLSIIFKHHIDSIVSTMVAN